MPPPALTDPVYLAEAELVSTTADRSYGLLRHLLVDEESDALLWLLIVAVSTAYDAQAKVAFGDDLEPAAPWRTLTDPRVAPLEHLRYSTQWAGGIVPPRRPGEGDAAYLERARLEAEYPRGPKRTTKRAAEIIAEQFLTGTQHFVMTFDRDNRLIVYCEVIDAELSDPAGLLAALNHPDVAAAGQRFEFVPEGPDAWNQITSGHSWDEVSGGMTWNTATTGV